MVDVLEEKLDPAVKKQLKLLKKQMAADPELKRMLSSPMEDIPQYYFLYKPYDTYRFARCFSLYQGLEFLALGKVKIEFIKEGKNFIGFIAYREDKDLINQVIKGSFKEASEEVEADLMSRFDAFVKRSLLKKKKVCWYVDKQNSKDILQSKEYYCLQGGRFSTLTDHDYYLEFQMSE